MTSTTMDTQAAPKPSGSSLGYRIAIGIFGVLLLLGIASYIEALINGHQSSGLNDSAPWGLYIAGFIFFVGASAGSTMIGILIHAFGRKDYEPLGTRAILFGFLCLVASVLFILVDQGYIFRTVLVPWIWHNFTSPFAYTSFSYYLFGVVLLGELYYTVKIVRGEADESDKKKAKVLAIAAAPLALLVLHALSGTLFAVAESREFWNSALLPPHFAVVALLSGTAGLSLVVLATNKLKGIELLSKKTMSHLAFLIVFLLFIVGFFDFFDFVVLAYSNSASGSSALHMLLDGSNLWLTILHVGGYTTGFIILLGKRRRENASWIATGAICILVSVAAYRYSLVTTGLFVPLLPFIKAQVYHPTLPEIAIMLGIVSAISLGYLIIIKKLPLEEDQKSDSPSSPSITPPAGQQSA